MNSFLRGLVIVGFLGGNSHADSHQRWFSLEGTVEGTVLQSDQSFANGIGMMFGVGAGIRPWRWLVIGLRATAGVGDSVSSDALLMFSAIGPIAQLWLHESLWISGGVGGGGSIGCVSTDKGSGCGTSTGLSWDGRAGVEFRRLPDGRSLGLSFHVGAVDSELMTYGLALGVQLH